MKKQKYLSLIVVGITVIISYFIYYQLPISKSEGGVLLGGLGSLLLRTAGLYWIYEITKLQNRKSILFCSLGFFIPAITMIILGFIGDKSKEELN